MNEQNKISQRIEKLISKVNSELRAGLEEPIQNELVQLINLLPDLKRSTNSHLFISTVEVGISALLLEQPNVKLAKEIREVLQRRIRREKNPIRALFSGVLLPELHLLW